MPHYCLKCFCERCHQIRINGCYRQAHEKSYLSIKLLNKWFRITKYQDYSSTLNLTVKYKLLGIHIIYSVKQSMKLFSDLFPSVCLNDAIRCDLPQGCSAIGIDRFAISAESRGLFAVAAIVT